MNFPSAWQFVSEQHIFLLTGPAMLAVSTYVLFRAARSRSGSSDSTPQSRRRDAYIGLFFLLLGAVHAGSIGKSALNALRFRFDPKEVAELRIVTTSEEDHSVGTVEQTIRDRVLITSGLSSLTTSSAVHRNHEHFLNGFRIELVMDGPASTDRRFLSVYRRSSRGGDVAIVIPHLGLEHSGVIHNAGEYNCPPFHEWIATNVDPLFVRQPADDTGH